MVQTPPHILVLIDLFALEVVNLCHCAWADPEGGQGVETPNIDSDRRFCA